MREPKHSCPDIDQMKRSLKLAKDHIDDAVDEIEKIFKLAQEEQNFYLFEDLLNGAKKSAEFAADYVRMNDELEEIRDLNSDLRSWGSHWESEYQKLESQS